MMRQRTKAPDKKKKKKGNKRVNKIDRIVSDEREN